MTAESRHVWLEVSGVGTWAPVWRARGLLSVRVREAAVGSGDGLGRRAGPDTCLSSV